MSRRLLAINVLLVAIALASLGVIARELTAPPPPTTAPPSRPAAAPAPATAEPARPPAPAYAVVASRNLFSPTRSEAPAATGPAAAAASQLPKPTLHGIILRDGAPIAYLEDPATKRVAGYRLGDRIAGGTVQTIAADHVVIARADDRVDVRLRDPAKPRPAAPPGPAQPATGMPGPVPLPGMIPPSAPAVLPPSASGAQPPSSIMPPVGGRRLLLPNLLRRVPQSPGPDAAPR